ncbi:MAG: chromate efflux transporter [Gammaproteobacteria bacterium]
MTTGAGPPDPVSFGAALRWWLRLGFISFGGPAGQIAIMHDELVVRRRWISERRFLHALNYCMVLPGPEAQQLATYIGWLLHGARGGIAAGVLFVLPSFFLLVALSWIYVRYGQVPAVAGVLYGLKPAVTAIVLYAAWRVGRRALHDPVLWGIAALAFTALVFADLAFPRVIVAAAAIGFAGGRLAPARFAPPARDPVLAQRDAAVIDDDTPPPAHARHSRTRFVRTLVVGVALGSLAWGALVLAVGADHPLSRMGAFFTGAALVTFGGAYAVLPYVVQAAVVKYGWLTAPQMIDGLALGETTPGPLIMVVAFVGFLGAGFAGALVATVFTFLPSFLFILLGGPLVEATREDVKLTAPLTAVTAAVVGVIANLAVFFAGHVLWLPGGDFDWIAATIAAGAAIALIRYDAGIIRTLVACALIGSSASALTWLV